MLKKTSSCHIRHGVCAFVAGIRMLVMIASLVQSSIDTLFMRFVLWR